MTKGLFFIFALSLSSCQNTSEQKTARTPQNVESKSPVNSNLEKEIDSYISFCDSSMKHGSLPFISVLFISQNDSCLLWLVNSLYYNEKHFDGFTKLKGKMIMFHNVDSSCNRKLVDKKLLLKNIPPKLKNPIFMDPNEARGKKFQILENNELRFLWEGFI